MRGTHYYHTRFTRKPGYEAFTRRPDLGNAVKECLVMVGALNLKTKPAQLWARDGGQDDRAEGGADPGGTQQKSSDQTGQVPRAQANPSSVSAERVIEVRKAGAMSPSSPCSCEHPRV